MEADRDRADRKVIMSKRALRRHHRARMIARARAVTRFWYNIYEPYQMDWVRGPDGVLRRELVPKRIDFTQSDAVATRVADYLAVCSCWMCGNPRRHQGERTRQELLADLALEEAVSELGEPSRTR